MAEIAKSGTPSLCSQLPPHSHRIPFDGIDNDDVNVLGEAVAAGDLVCVRADGLVYRSDATGGAADVNASFHGVAPQALTTGEPISAIWGERFHYGSGLTPGTFYYPSGTVIGGIADTPAYVGQQPVGFAVNTNVIQFLQPTNGNV